MVEMVLGLLGALLGAGLFALGYVFGRKTCVSERGEPAKPQVVFPDITEEERLRREEARQQLEEEQKAFSTLMSYNVNDAYGYNIEDLKRERGSA